MIKNANILLLVILTICSNSIHANYKQKIDTTKNKIEDVSIFGKCIFSNKELDFEIDSCNCGNKYTAKDTVFINLTQADGGEIQGRILKITKPICDSSTYILMKHQNRCFISSMGPDPILTNWILYNSSIDTVRFDSQIKGFYIDTIAQIEQEKFLQFDTLDFYNAYLKVIGEKIDLDYIPDIANVKLYHKYLKYKEKAKVLLASSGVELHRIIIDLKKESLSRKVIVFTFGHYG